MTSTNHNINVNENNNNKLLKTIISLTPRFVEIQSAKLTPAQQHRRSGGRVHQYAYSIQIISMLHSLLKYVGDDNWDQIKIILIVNGSTESLKENSRIILTTACIDCNCDMYPPQVSHPLSSIASTPRLPEHCIEYVKII